MDNKKHINDFARVALDAIFALPKLYATTNFELQKQLEVIDCKISLDSYLEGLQNCIVTVQPIRATNTPYLELSFDVNVYDVDVRKPLIIEINKDFNGFIVYWKNSNVLVKQFVYDYKNNSKRF